MFGFFCNSFIVAFVSSFHCFFFSQQIVLPVVPLVFFRTNARASDSFGFRSRRFAFRETFSYESLCCLHCLYVRLLLQHLQNWKKLLVRRPAHCSLHSSVSCSFVFHFVSTTRHKHRHNFSMPNDRSNAVWCCFKAHANDNTRHAIPQRLGKKIAPGVDAALHLIGFCFVCFQGCHTAHCSQRRQNGTVAWCYAVCDNDRTCQCLVSETNKKKINLQETRRV